MNSPSVPIVIFTVTRYQGEGDQRYTTCLATLHAAAAHQIPIVVVDSSPDAKLRDNMAATGAIVSRQSVDGLKGVALREALKIATGVPGVEADTLLCWQEPEKTGMVHLWPEVADAVQSIGADVVIPARGLSLFQKTYPIEQFYSESFANALVGAMAIKAGLQLPHPGEPPLDWHFGPLAFLRRHAQLWLADTGELWDAQLMPVVRAAKVGLRILSHEVPFEAPASMKAEEEGNLAFIEKRLMQINFLAPKFRAAFGIDNNNADQNKTKDG